MMNKIEHQVSRSHFLLRLVVYISIVVTVLKSVEWLPFLLRHKWTLGGNNEMGNNLNFKFWWLQWVFWLGPL